MSKDQPSIWSSVGLGNCKIMWLNCDLYFIWNFICFYKFFSIQTNQCWRMLYWRQKKYKTSIFILIIFHDLYLFLCGHLYQKFASYLKDSYQVNLFWTCFFLEYSFFFDALLLYGFVMLHRLNVRLFQLLTKFRMIYMHNPLVG